MTMNKNSLKNLKPWKKGERPKGSGKPVGSVDLKTHLLQMFNTIENADLFRQIIWTMCVEDKNPEMIKTVLKVAGALETKVKISNEYNPVCDENILERARQYALSAQPSGSV